MIEIPPSLSSANLVAISINMLNRGVPQPRAEISFPTEDDVSNMMQDKNNSPVLLPLAGKPKRNDETYTTLSEQHIKSEREIVGYVTTGTYSLQKGFAHGHGFVTLKALLASLQRSDLRKWSCVPPNKSGESWLDNSRINDDALLCLVRAHDSRQYRYALLNVHV